MRLLLSKNCPTREEKIEKKRWESFFEKLILDIYFCPFLTFPNILWKKMIFYHNLILSCQCKKIFFQFVTINFFIILRKSLEIFSNETIWNKMKQKKFWKVLKNIIAKSVTIVHHEKVKLNVICKPINIKNWKMKHLKQKRNNLVPKSSNVCAV